MGNVGSSLASDIQTSNDNRYPLKTDVYNKTTAEATFASQTALANGLSSKLNIIDAENTYASKIALANGLATKLNITDAENKYATKEEVGTINTSLGLKLNSADAQNLYASRADVTSLSSAVTANTSNITSLQNQVTNLPVFNPSLIYSKADIDAMLSNFRNSLGLPPINPFAAYPNVDAKFNDQMYLKNITSETNCAAACASIYGQAMEYNSNTQDCWCKYSTGQPVRTSTGATTYINNNKKTTGSWRDVNSMPDTSTFNNAQQLPAPVNCLQPSAPTAAYQNTPQSTNTQVKIDTCTGDPTQILTYNPIDMTLKNGNAQCMITPDGKTVQFNDCTAPSSAGNAQKWTWTNQGELVTNNPPTGSTGNYCLDVAGGNIAPGTPVGLYQCNNTMGQKWYPAFEWATYQGHSIGDPTTSPYNLTGTDLPSGTNNPTTVSGYADCRKQCSQIGACEFITYTPNTTGTGGTCTLQKRIPPNLPSTDPRVPIVMGIKYPNGEIRYNKGTDPRGYDIPGFDLGGSNELSLQNCANRCSNMAGCEFFSYLNKPDGSGNNCYPKQSTTATAPGTIYAWKPVGNPDPTQLA